MPSYRLNDLAVGLTARRPPCFAFSMCQFTPGCGPHSWCPLSICLVVSCGYSLGCGAASCGPTSPVARVPPRGDPAGQLGVLKAQLRQEIAAVEQWQAITTEMAAPRTTEEAEEAERQLTAALEHVRARREELRRQQKK